VPRRHIVSHHFYLYTIVRMSKASKNAKSNKKIKKDSAGTGADLLRQVNRMNGLFMSDVVFSLPRWV